MSGRYFIFLRTKRHAGCDALTYWKPIQQEGCFVGKVSSEKDALVAAKKLFDNNIQEYQNGDDKRALSFHIVDIEYHSIILVGTEQGIRDLRKNPQRNKIESPDTEVQMTKVTYRRDGNIEFKKLGELW